MSWLDTLEAIRKQDFSNATEGEREKAARDIITMCSYACAVVAVSPIPFSDVVLMLPIQTGMVMTVGHIYGRRVDKASARDLILELGATAGVGLLARQGIKALLPVVGAILTIPAAFAANWAIGRVAMEYFRNPDASGEYLSEVFKKAKREGGSLFSKDTFDRFRKRNEAAIHEVAKASEDEGGGEGEEEEAAPAPKKKAAPAKKTVEKKPLGKKPAAKKSAAPKTARSRTAKKKASGDKSDTESSDEDGGAEEVAPAPLTVKSLIEQELPRRLKGKNELTNRLKAVVHLDISGAAGGQWTLDFGKPGKWVRKGLDGTPNITVRCKDDDFLKIATGQKDPRMAVFSGTLEFEPMDLELAGQIGQLFS